MKLFITALALCLFFGCSSQKDPKTELYETAQTSIKGFISGTANDPSSIDVELSTPILKLDTIKDPELFKGTSGAYVVRAKYRGKNAFGATVLNEKVFFLTEEGTCYFSVDPDRLSQKESWWLLESGTKAQFDTPL